MKKNHNGLVLYFILKLFLILAPHRPNQYISKLLSDSFFLGDIFQGVLDLP